MSLRLLSTILTREDLSAALRARILTTRGWINTRAGRTEEALADLREAQRLDPARADHYRETGEALREAGRAAEGLADVRYAAALDPSPGNLQVLAFTLSDLGRFDEAVGPALSACEAVRTQQSCAVYATCLWRAGRRQEARDAAARATRLDPVNGSYNMACYHAVAGDRVEALRYLRRAVEEGTPRAYISGDPDLKSLHGDPEFEAIVAEVHRILDR